MTIYMNFNYETVYKDDFFIKLPQQLQRKLKKIICKNNSNNFEYFFKDFDTKYKIPQELRL
jgi:hypothetical protein